jgi:hypothetical protein
MLVRFPLRALSLALLLGLAACGGGEELTNNPGPTQGQQAPDFSIEDVNPNSATSASQVSPRQHVGRISAWYFGHAT